MLELFLQLLYSPTLAPGDYFDSLTWKNDTVKEFTSDEDIIAKTSSYSEDQQKTSFLDGLNKSL